VSPSISHDRSQVWSYIVKVIIPAKSNSERVHNKNFCEFYQGQSLFDIKIKQLLEVLPAGDIYVSSENPEVENLTKKYGLQFLPRTEHLTRNETPFAEVITSLIGEIPGDDDVMWVTVTEPFFCEFEDCLRTWAAVREEHDSLVVVKPLTEFILDANGQPVNYQFGPWHLASQFLPKWFSVPHALHIVKRDTIRRCNYIIGTSPKLYVSTSRSIDIDDEFDFRIAKELYELVSVRVASQTP